MTYLCRLVPRFHPDDPSPGRRPMGGMSHDATHAMGPRVSHLQPTMFVDALPELAAERARSRETN
jgi:hypothetical protein